jgi:phage/plasmid-like protein (TIGR03299 family)
MADNINYANGKHSFFSKKEVPWHGLGQIVEYAVNSEEAIKLAGLDFNVQKVEIFTDFRELPITGTSVDDIREASVEGHYATVRTDTRDVLGLVKSRYEVVQNVKAFDFIDEIVGSKQAVFETAGALGKGETIFVTAKIPNISVIGTNDVIENYFLFTSSHDGSGSIIACITPIRVVCNNTLNMAMDNNSNKIKLKHTKNVHDKLELGLELMGLYRRYSVELSDCLIALSHVPITSEDVQIVTRQIILNREEIAICSVFGINDDRISARKRNKLEDLEVYIDQGVGQDLHRGTALWLYNGISSYYNNGLQYKNSEERFVSLTEGSSYKDVQKAFDLICNAF